MDEKRLLTILLDALPLIASITGGYAAITDSEGRRIKTVDSSGNELLLYKGAVYELAKKSAQQKKALIGPSQIVAGAEAWVIPIGPYVISASNVDKVKREYGLKDALEKALPLIAKVAGGEAVIFDKNGKRLSSYNPDGTVNHKFLNKISEAAKRAMALQEPVIGESFSYEGAMAVRIPITQEFGLGFNNELAARKNQKLFEEVKKFQNARYNFSDIVGQSEAIKQTIAIAENVANGVSTILIYGETGTGKELFAQSIHNASDRRDKPFVAINCGALPPSLIESNLFGYVEGAFTGAKKGGVPGAFEQANGGTIFLDEISEMDPNLQTKLLRVLQEREVVRIGGVKPIRIDVRVIASTNKDLTKLIEEGSFRSDLYYRLNVIQIKVPPLRERISDIPLLVNYFIRKYNTLLGKYVLEASQEALQILQEYNWPGNVRELQNCIENALNMTQKDEKIIYPHHLPPYIQDMRRQRNFVQFKPIDQPMGGKTLDQILAEAERDIIKQALLQAKHVKKEAATLLGISTTTLWRKMVQYQLQD